MTLYILKGDTFCTQKPCQIYHARWLKKSSFPVFRVMPPIPVWGYPRTTPKIVRQHGIWIIGFNTQNNHSSTNITILLTIEEIMIFLLESHNPFIKDIHNPQSKNLFPLRENLGALPRSPTNIKTNKNITKKKEIIK